MARPIWLNRRTWPTATSASGEHRDPLGVVVTGMVHQPGRYPYPVGNEFRVLDAIASAQGTSYKVIPIPCSSAARSPGKNDRVLIQVSLREVFLAEAE